MSLDGGEQSWRLNPPADPLSPEAEEWVRSSRPQRENPENCSKCFSRESPSKA